MGKQFFKGGLCVGLYRSSENELENEGWAG
jgi:hypothetical protein